MATAGRRQVHRVLHKARLRAPPRHQRVVRRRREDLLHHEHVLWRPDHARQLQQVHAEHGPRHVQNHDQQYAHGHFRRFSSLRLHRLLVRAERRRGHLVRLGAGLHRLSLCRHQARLSALLVRALLFRSSDVECDKNRVGLANGRRERLCH